MKRWPGYGIKQKTAFVQVVYPSSMAFEGRKVGFQKFRLGWNPHGEDVLHQNDRCYTYRRVAGPPAAFWGMTVCTQVDKSNISPGLLSGSVVTRKSS
jgi:hypothetical protein